MKYYGYLIDSPVNGSVQSQSRQAEKFLRRRRCKFEKIFVETRVRRNITIAVSSMSVVLSNRKNAYGRSAGNSDAMSIYGPYRWRGQSFAVVHARVFIRRNADCISTVCYGSEHQPPR